MRQAISSDGAPKAIGPYSQAIRAGQLLFLSGQVPLDPATGQLVGGDVAGFGELLEAGDDDAAGGLGEDAFAFGEELDAFDDLLVV